MATHSSVLALETPRTEEPGGLTVHRVAKSRTRQDMHTVQASPPSAAVVGSQDPTLGMNMVGAHIDAPRLDFKPNPLCDDGGFVMAAGKIFKLLPTAALLACAVTATTEKQKVAVASKR